MYYFEHAEETEKTVVQKKIEKTEKRVCFSNIDSIRPEFALAKN